jgi:hypothetical protein
MVRSDWRHAEHLPGRPEHLSSEADRDAGRGAVTASLCRLLTGAAVGQLAQQVDVPKVTCGLFD